MTINMVLVAGMAILACWWLLKLSNLFKSDPAFRTGKFNATNVVLKSLSLSLGFSSSVNQDPCLASVHDPCPFCHDFSFWLPPHQARGVPSRKHSLG